jgi:hypothetical protein
MKRAFFSDSIKIFKKISTDEIIGKIVLSSGFSDDLNQKSSWKSQIDILKNCLVHEGKIFIEYSIPRMGKRIDVLLIIENIIFIIEFKVGEKDIKQNAIDQVWDYALDLSNFHETSQNQAIIPILITTKSKLKKFKIESTKQNKNIAYPIVTNGENLSEIIEESLQFSNNKNINPLEWEKGSYSPTPTIIEAAMALYNNHDVKEITRSDAEAINLNSTTETISKIIHESKKNHKKSIIFITGVPGAGKTLVGLNIATKFNNKDFSSVYLSGNGPLVDILREAITRDTVLKQKKIGYKLKKSEVESKVKAFIQNVHHFRDEGITDHLNAPKENIAIFDEAQRAWNTAQLSNFMNTKKGEKNFLQSEPEFLISCMDRHKDWAVVICLVGNGQEINTGEAGIQEWLYSIERKFKNWNIYYSENFTKINNELNNALNSINKSKINKLHNENNLHLSVSIRSFRSEKISSFVKNLLDIKPNDAKKLYLEFNDQFPIVLTRDFSIAKKWLRGKASGSERYGMIVSSKAERLKPYAIHVKNNPIEPIPWFLNSKEDVRSSYYLEDVATEFKIQGLELDWVCVAWDADFRFKNNDWENWAFKGFKWLNINKEERKNYQKNAYRVLLTRARQGMVIVVPYGDSNDHTRKPEFYDSTYHYLKSIGIVEI